MFKDTDDGQTQYCLLCEEWAVKYEKLKEKHKQAEQKLKRIRESCAKTISLMNEDSSNNAYAGGRCIEARNILQIIEEVE